MDLLYFPPHHALVDRNDPFGFLRRHARSALAFLLHAEVLLFLPALYLPEEVGVFEFGVLAAEFDEQVLDGGVPTAEGAM
jgi:hypothetical protein